MRPILKAINIKWDIDMETLYEIFNEMSIKEAAKYLELSPNFYKNMSEEDREDYIEDAFHHNRLDALDFVDIPKEISLQDDFLWDEDTISDYISNETGYCHYGFNIDCNMSIEDMQKELTIVDNEKDKELLENAISIMQSEY